MRELVEYMVKNLVDDVDRAAVTEVENDDSIVFELRVAPDDMGKVIGKEGRIAKSMRALLKVASTNQPKRAFLEIV